MPGGLRRQHWSSWCFRALLALYPGEFRDEYGRELALVFADRYRDAAGLGDRVLIVLEAITGVLKEAPKEHLSMILQDLRYACRVLLRMPGFAATAILTLALGIGANTAIFQLIDAVRLRPLPVRSPGELARIEIVGGNGGFGLNPGQYGGLTTPIWRELESHQQAFSGMFAWSASTMGVGDRSDLRRVSGLRVSGGFFRVLGIDAWRGRLIEPADETTCPSPRVVLSHAYWQRELGGRELDRSARLMVNGESYEVIGVTPPGFFGVAVGESFDIAVPHCRQQNPRRDVFDVAVMARLRPGWTLDRASAHVNTLSGGIFEATAPTGYGTGSIERFKQFRLEAVSAATGVSALRAQYDTSLQLLLGITGLVLLLACANLANLMLARAVVRQREFSVRLALGASRTRLVRQSLAESAVLSACGAVVGIVLAQFLSRVLVWSLAADGNAPTLTLAASWRMLAFTAGVAILTCLCFGLAPALRSMRIQPATVMQVGGRAMTSGERFSIQRMMVITQIAVSVVLLVAALLFVRSFRNLMTFDAGMRQQGVTVAFIGFHQLKVERDALNDVQRQILAEIRGIPGVVSAGSTSNVPLMGSSWEHGIQVDTIEHSSKFTWVSPGYFETMNIPILQGRDFTLADTTGSPRVAVVNQTFVRRFVPDGQADRPEAADRSGAELSVDRIRDRRRDSRYAIQHIAERAGGPGVRAGLAVARAGPMDQPHDPLDDRSRRDRGQREAPARGKSSRVGLRLHGFPDADSRRTRARAAAGDAGRILRRARGAAGDDRPLRHDVVRDGPASARDRHPRRARRAPVARRPDGDAGSGLASDPGHRGGRVDVAPGRPERDDVVVQPRTERSRDARRRLRPADPHRRARELPPRAQGGAAGPVGGA